MGALAAAIPALAQGVTPVQSPDILSQAAQIQGLRNQRAEIANQTARTQAEVANLGAQAQNTQVEAALKQRDLAAKQEYARLAQAHSVKGPDGATSTDWGSVLGDLEQKYPEYALSLRNSLLDRDQKQTALAKNQFELKSAQQKSIGMQGALAGFADDSIAQDPQKATQAYNSLYQTAQQTGLAHLLPGTPQDFAKNPRAYTTALSKLVQQSGGMAQAIDQQNASLDQYQKQMGAARNAYSQAMEGAQSPQDVKTIQDSLVGQYGPHVVAGLHLPPPGGMSLAGLKQDARVAAMSPDKRQEAVETARHDVATELNQNITARAEQTRAASSQVEARAALAQAGAAQTRAAADVGEFEQKYGVDLKGKPIVSSGVAQNAPTLNVPQANGTTKQMDLSSFGPYQAESPAVQRETVAILAGKPVSARSDDPVQIRAYNLATKINPQFQDQAQARGKLLNESTGLITNANTAIQHSQDLMEKVDAVKSGNLRVLNRATLLKNVETGKPAPSELEAVRNQYAAEIQKYFNGGAFTQGEYEKALDSLATAGSPQQLKGVIKSTNKMLYQGVSTREQEYNNTLGGNILGSGQSFLQPASKAVLQKQGVVPREVGETVNIRGKQMKITKVHPDGSFDAK